MVCGAGALALAAFGYFIVQTILKSLDRACDVARAIARGDLLLKFATAASDETLKPRPTPMQPPRAKHAIAAPQRKLGNILKITK